MNFFLCKLKPLDSSLPFSKKNLIKFKKWPFFPNAVAAPSLSLDAYYSMRGKEQLCNSFNWSTTDYDLTLSAASAATAILDFLLISSDLIVSNIYSRRQFGSP